MGTHPALFGTPIAGGNFHAEFKLMVGFETVRAGLGDFGEAERDTLTGVGSWPMVGTRRVRQSNSRRCARCSSQESRLP